MSKRKLLAIFDNHTYDILKYNISIHNMSHIIDYFENICVVDTINFEYSNKLKDFFTKNEKINNFLLIENNEYFDFGKWIYALNNINYYDYDYIVFINDSIFHFIIYHSNRF
jgi:hypothetical protein